MVVLGGKAVKANIELHLINGFWAKKIEDKYGTLIIEWFGSNESLHIESFNKLRT